MGDARINIRPLEKSDEAQWRGLWRGYLRYYEAQVGEDVYASTFARLLSREAHEFHALVAEQHMAEANPPAGQNARLVGLVHYLFHRHCWKIEDVCYLQDLYTEPALRGQGIGRALIEAVYEAADRAGAPGVYWLTQDFNTPARRLYDRVAKVTPFIKYVRP